MKKIISLIAFTCYFGYSQSNSSCVNIDFENGNMNGWIGETGNCCPISTNPSGIINGRHTVMSGTGTDPFSEGNITVVAPGSTYSARLGNSSVGAESERIRYTLTVDQSNSLFIYKYAVILEDPNHTGPEQPRFQLRVLDLNGALIDPTCGSYTVVAAATIPGFISSGSIRYKDWTTVGLDLSLYFGQTIQLEFSTGDCSQGGHFGYAYVDAACSPLEVGINYCTGSLSAELSAPDGFEYLWSNGSTSQSIFVDDPQDGNTYSCLMTSVTGCQVEISAILEPQDPLADFEILDDCYNTVVFDDVSFIPNNTILDNYQWNFGDGNTYAGFDPVHAYDDPGVYSVSLTIANNSGCISTITKEITVQSPDLPTANQIQEFCDFALISDLQIEGESITFYDSSSGGNILESTEELQNDQQVYATQTVDGCESNEREFISIIIYQTPAPIAEADQYFCNYVYIEEIEIEGEELKWYYDLTSTQPVNVNTEFVSSQTLYATQTLNNCESLTNIAINIIIEYPPEVESGFTPIELCDQGSGRTVFDLINLKDIAQVSEPNNLITFYSNYSDADLGVNALSETSPYSFYNQTNRVYLRVEENICYRIYEFETITKVCFPIIPQGFSPNKDSFNDYFNIKQLYDVFYDHELIIFSRWGQEVFRGGNDEKWDGVANRGSNSGSIVPVGTYFYQLQINNGNDDVYSGWVYVNY